MSSSSFVFGNTRVCIHPTCETVWHNCKPKDTKCKNCGYRINKVNYKTFVKDYQDFPHQYCYQTEDFFWIEEGKQVKLFD